MKHEPFPSPEPELQIAARLAIGARSDRRPLRSVVTTQELRDSFDVPLREAGRPSPEVIDDLVAAATPGLVGSTDPGFMAWVVGGSHPAGVAADWLASAWGQNAALFQTAPAAAVAEETVGKWLIDLLGLPAQSSVGFTTGATMAAFTCLAAARMAVLSRAGYNLEEHGMVGAPPIRILLAGDAHVTNYAALRYLGFGNSQITRVASTDQGVFDLDRLAAALAEQPDFATIVIGQAGHIMSGAFDEFECLARLCRKHNAWLHVDGAFGLWVQATPRYRHLASGVELADSWSVDGHKWLQLPYDCGFAIVREREWHRRAMSMEAGYFLREEEPVHNPSDYVPELSRRARGFAAWTMLQVLGRKGVAAMVECHCDAAYRLAQLLEPVDGIVIRNTVCLNQLAIGFRSSDSNLPSADLAMAMANRLNGMGRYFLRTAQWNGETVLRISIISHGSDNATITQLADDIIGQLSLLIE